MQPKTSEVINLAVSVASTVVALVAVALTQLSNTSRAELEVQTRLTQIETDQKYILLYIQELKDGSDKRRAFPKSGGVGE